MNRATTLSRLCLSNEAHAQELLGCLRTFLSRTDRGGAAKNLKPKARKHKANDFLRSTMKSGKTHKSHFWPSHKKSINDTEIVDLVSDLMCLESNAIPRARPGPSQATEVIHAQATPPWHTEEEFPDSDLEHAATEARREMNSRCPDLAVKSMGLLTFAELDARDPTYTEPISDFLEDTTRETRQRTNTSITMPHTPQNFPDPAQSSLGRSPTVFAFPTSRPVHGGNVITLIDRDSRLTPSNDSQPSNVQSLLPYTPPATSNRLGKRRALSSDSLDDLPSLTTLMTGQLTHERSSCDNPLAKRARVDSDEDGDIPFEQPNSPMRKAPLSSSLARQHSIHTVSTDGAQSQRYGSIKGRPGPTKETTTNTKASPPMVDFESFCSPTAAGVAIDLTEHSGPRNEEQSVSESSDHISIDFAGVDPPGLFELPTIFLDHLRRCREGHERHGTNESRVRAVVLKDIEEQLRQNWAEA